MRRGVLLWLRGSKLVKHLSQSKWSSNFVCDTAHKVSNAQRKREKTEERERVCVIVQNTDTQYCTARVSHTLCHFYYRIWSFFSLYHLSEGSRAHREKKTQVGFFSSSFIVASLSLFEFSGPFFETLFIFIPFLIICGTGLFGLGF